MTPDKENKYMEEFNDSISYLINYRIKTNIY